MLFFSIAISFIACGGSGENDENLLAGNGNTEKPKGGRIRSLWFVASHLLGELNQGTPIINSHADVTETLFIDDELSDACDYGIFVSSLSSYKKR